MNVSQLVCVFLCAVQLPAAELVLASEKPTINRRTGLFEIPLSELRRVSEHGDKAELARLAARIGTARLGQALEDADRRIVLAALDGISVVPGGVILLDRLVPLFVSPDPAMVASAVRTTAILLATNDPAQLALQEVADETRLAICRALAATAANENVALMTRIFAVQGMADAKSQCVAVANANLAPLLASPVPEIRRATVLSLIPDSDAGTRALLAAEGDRDGRVAAAAGARVCQRRLRGNTPAVPLERPLRQVVLAEGAAAEDMVEILPCLAASSEAADRKTLDHLRGNAPTAVRDAVKRLEEKQ